MPATDTHRAIDAVWKMESPRLIAGLARIVRDIGVAEDLAQDALVAALEQWPASGVPDNPGAWLMAAAKNRAIDHFRRKQRLERKHEELGREGVVQKIGTREVREGEAQMEALDAALDDNVGDDLLRLVFISCHPVLSTDARVALTLRLLGGLTTDEIARAFLLPGADHRPAHRPRQAHSGGKARSFRSAARGRTGRPSVVGARGYLPGLQRRLLGDRRRRLAAARALRGSAAAGPDPG